jgi:predicted O-methyltransferase YrrM
MPPDPAQLADLAAVDDTALLAEVSRRLGLPYTVGSYYLPLVSPAEVAAADADRRPVIDPARLFDRGVIEAFAATLAPHHDPGLPDYDTVRALRLGLGYNPIAAQLYYQVVRATGPDQVIEIGAGLSTFYAHRALAGSGRIVCVEPYPSAEFAAWCGAHDVELRAARLQDAIDGLDFTDRTLLFIDSTHVCSPVSELHRVFIDLLPRVRSGCLIHFDDIFLPFSCLFREHNSFAGSVNWYESTLLGIFLSASDAYETVFPQFWMGRDATLRPAMEMALPLYRATHWGGGAYWIRKR